MSVNLVHYKKENFQSKVDVTVPKEKENSYPFQWLLFKPQLHAVEPFEINKASRNENTVRAGLEPATSRLRK